MEISSYLLTISEEKSSIPRFVRYALNMPNFSKIHAAHFKKMESVDDYVQRKTEKVKDVNKSINATPKPVRFYEYSSL